MKTSPTGKMALTLFCSFTHILLFLTCFLTMSCHAATTDDTSRRFSKETSVIQISNTTPPVEETSQMNEIMGNSSCPLPPEDPVPDNRTVLSILGLFALTESTTYSAGPTFKTAAEIALEEINARNDVLPEYKLVLDVVDTQCDQWVGMDRMYRKLYDKTTTKVMTIGATCSHVTEITALTSKSFNLSQVSYSALSPTLSSMEVYDNFFRVLAPENVLSEFRIRLLRRFNWTTVSIMQETFNLFSSTVEKWRQDLEANNITLNRTEPFNDNPKNAIQNMMKNDARIIYFAFYEDKARIVCCTAYNLSFHRDNKRVWIFPGFYDHMWYKVRDTNCTPEQILEVVEGYFTVQNVNLDDNVTDPVSLKPDEFNKRFDCKYEGVEEDEKPRGPERAPLGFDAMWAIALALNKTEQDLNLSGSSLRNFTYSNKEMGDLIRNNLRDLSFMGLGGQVSFSEHHHKQNYKIAIKQFQRNSKEKHHMVTIGEYIRSEDKMIWYDDRVRWKGGATLPPLSSRQTKFQLKPLSRQLYAIMCCLAGIGVLLAIAFLVFNVKNRNVRLIKMSSPNINNLILIGCMLVYGTIVTEDVSGKQMDLFCHAGVYLLVLGFSLGYGALFAKTWRVYEIMTASRVLNKKALRDSRLFMTVGVLVGINLLVLIIWTACDPMKVVKKNLDETSQERDGDITIVYQALSCSSELKQHFTWVLLALQTILILFGAFLALQTRKMSIPELNDSRWVGLSIYCVVLLGSIGVIHMLVSRSKPDDKYIFSSILVFAGTTLTQCLVFVPKLIAYRRSRKPRTGSERSVITFRTVCIAGSSTSLSSSAASAQAVASTPSRQSFTKDEPPGADDASLHAALRRCSSIDESSSEQSLRSSVKKPVKISRGVSTCNLLADDEVFQSVENSSEKSSLVSKDGSDKRMIYVTPGSKMPFPPGTGILESGITNGLGPRSNLYCTCPCQWNTKGSGIELLARHSSTFSAIGHVTLPDHLHWPHKNGLHTDNCLSRKNAKSSTDCDKDPLCQPLSWLQPRQSSRYVRRPLQLRRSLSDEQHDNAHHHPLSRWDGLRSANGDVYVCGSCPCQWAESTDSAHWHGQETQGDSADKCLDKEQQNGQCLTSDAVHSSEHKIPDQTSVDKQSTASVQSQRNGSVPVPNCQNHHDYQVNHCYRNNEMPKTDTQSHGDYDSVHKGTNHDSRYMTQSQRTESNFQNTSYCPEEVHRPDSESSSQSTKHSTQNGHVPNGHASSVSNHGVHAPSVNRLASVVSTVSTNKGLTGPVQGSASEIPQHAKDSSGNPFSHTTPSPASESLQQPHNRAVNPFSPTAPSTQLSGGCGRAKRAEVQSPTPFVRSSSSALLNTDSAQADTLRRYLSMDDINVRVHPQWHDEGVTSFSESQNDDVTSLDKACFFLSN